MMGPDQPVILHLLDIPPAATALEGVRMELVDAAFPLLAGVVATTDVAVAAAGVDVAVMVGGFPRKAGMERKDVMSKNVSIYAAQAAALAAAASPDVKVVVVANPANTNALMLARHAPSIPAKNITALTRLDHNRALGQLAEKAGAAVASVTGTIIWGNHSSTQVPDAAHATIGGNKAADVINDAAWLATDFISTVQQRGAAIITARGASSALSAASAACDHVRDWVRGTKEGEWVSMAVSTEGGVGAAYGAPDGVVFSLPVTCKDGEWSVVEGLAVDDATRAKIEASGAELVEERDLALACLGE